MRMMALDNQVRSGIKKLVDFAHQNVIPEEHMIAIANGTKPPMGDFPTFSINIPLGIRVVFTVEKHPQKTGESKTLKHISVSVDGLKYPSVELVNALLEEFGFLSKLGVKYTRPGDHVFHMWMEESVRAINVVEDL